MAESEGQGELTLYIEKTSKDGTVTRYTPVPISKRQDSLTNWFRKAVLRDGNRDSNERG